MKNGNYKKKGSSKGEGKSNSNSKSSDYKGGYKSKKKEVKFTPLDYKSQYAQASYVTVKDALIAEVTKTFDRAVKYVIASLEAEKRVEPDKPSLAKSTNTDAAVREIENEENVYIY
jgi:hypothetical protein